MSNQPQAPAIATTIRATRIEVVCPHCGEEQGGWCVTPNPATAYECDDCGGNYTVSPTAEIIISV